ncbi:hypothetical protein QCA50_020166 [Cerrena zonata]|uniref:CASTOR ACT domain-containing protein n=1 Tax=Cerrena zonata TaxID=2478898 RepID=A0AAW0FD73_9APHY
MSDSVTISLLPGSLSIVHVPRSRIHGLCHPLLRQLLLPNPTFLNITCNEIELSIFAEHHVLQEFEPLVKKDSRRMKMRGRTSQPSHNTPKRSTEEWEPIEMSAEKWNVFQIDSHSSGLDTSGARIHELSAPLAAAGISILYQSSYMSDFIFVKEHRMQEVISLFASAGFDFYSSDPQLLTSTLTSPMLSPLSADDTSSINLLDLGTSITSTTISSENGAVLTRSRSSTDASQTFHSLSKLHLTEIHQTDNESDANDGVVKVPRTSASSRSQSHSPSSCDVQILNPDLTCIGLADESADMWTLKIMKLVAFPDMIPGVAASGTNSRSHSMPSPHIESRPASISPLRSQLAETETPLGPTSDSETESGGSRSDATTQVGPESPKYSRRGYSDSPLFEVPQDRPWTDADADDASSEGDSSEDGSFYSATPDVVQSPVEMTGEHRLGPTGTYIPRPHLSHLNTEDTTTSAQPKRRRRKRAVSEADSLRYPKPDPLVPFFSFTRTPEGSSLMGSVTLLAALFPPSERHMVICSGELDIQDSRAASPEKVTESLQTIDEDGPLESGISDEDGELPEPEGTMKCLQIDLRKFGLDKHGLVSRFSKTLEDNGINHMYSSTFKTANLLVDKAHAARAQALLRSC